MSAPEATAAERDVSSSPQPKENNTTSSSSTSGIAPAVSSPSPVGNVHGTENVVAHADTSGSGATAPSAMGTGSSSSVVGVTVAPEADTGSNAGNAPITRADTVRKYNNIEDVMSPTALTHPGETAVTPSRVHSVAASTNAGKRANSLRRANIPPPLGLQSQPTTATSGATSNTTTTTNNTGNAPVSARLNIPIDPHARHFSIGSIHEQSPQRVTKPRVRYLGKLPRYGQVRPQGVGPQQQPTHGAAQPPPPPSQQQQMMLNAMMLQQQAQQQYMMMMGMYPYPYGGEVPMQMPMPMQYPQQYPQQYPLQSPMATQPPRSAMLPSFPPQTYPYFRNQSTIDSSSSSLLNKGLHQTLNHPHAAYAHTPTVARIPEVHEGSSVSRPPSHRKSRSMSSATASPTKQQPQPQQQQQHSPASSSSSGEEEADLAIESDALPTPVFTKPPVPPELMQGEIRIMQNKFSFEFPVNSPPVDRKMFLSICNKIWTESRELDKDI